VTPYEVLGVQPNASESEIRRAYVALARRFHPDVHPGGEDRMRLVNQAWAVLGDRERRAAWDRGQGGRDAPDHGFRPHDPVDHGVDPRDQVDEPYRQMPKVKRDRREMLTFTPVALFIAATGTAGSGFFFDNPAVIGLGVVLFSLACIVMIGVLLVAMVDARRDEG
jgi:hypothetical protein